MMLKNTDFRVILQGAKRAELSSSALVMPSTGWCGCGCAGGEAPTCPAFFEAFPADVALDSELSRNGGNKLGHRIAGKGGLTVSTPNICRSPGRALQLTWTATGPDAVKEAWVRASGNGGKTWRAVATGLTESRAEIDPLCLPAGKLLIEVVVHDGSRSAASKPIPFENPLLPPVPAILHPHEGRTLTEGETLYLWGTVAGQPGRSYDDLQYAWTLDGKPVGDEPHLFTVVPPPGEHQCQLAVRTATGESLGSSAVTFTSVAAEDLFLLSTGVHCCRH